MRLLLPILSLSIAFYAGVGRASAQTTEPAVSPESTPDPQGLAACHAMQNPLSRVQCYDEASGYQPQASGAPVQQAGGWVFVESEDEFTNRNVSYAFLDSDHANLPTTDAPVRLIARCDGVGGTELFVLAGGYIGATRDRVPVRFRFGASDAVSEVWNESTSGTAVFLPTNYRDFRTGLATRQDFVFEITDYRGRRSSARFEGLARNDEILEFVMGGCD